jgi:hypothetical protein
MCLVEMASARKAEGRKVVQKELKKALGEWLKKNDRA